MFGCGKCPLTFAKKSQADFHRRVAHQLTVAVTTFHGVEMDIKRGANSFFSCPNPGCDYESDNCAYFKKHVMGCLSTGPRAPPLATGWGPGALWERTTRTQFG
ncbi:hypothetical protein DFH28DRAFT_917292 [Melampsora americana]|nr:hypothetical protein DFH28DRAFT_917292 [Melampsora americana]